MDIEKIPSLIGRPYSLAVQDTPQRKDYQRFLLENTISFMATVSVASVIKVMEDLKKSDEPDLSKINAIIDMDRMALGTWCRILRETVDKVLAKEDKSKLFIPEICNFYATKSKSEKVVNELVSIRNKDAHGNPIPEDKLKQELDKRQVMLEQVMAELKFLENYQLLVIESFDVSEQGSVYNAREYSGDGYTAIEITTNASLPLHTPILYKDEKFLNLSPLCTYAKIDEQEEMHIAIFSKTLNREGTVAEYLNIGGHSSINIKEHDAQKGLTYSDKFATMRDIFSDPSNEPVANVELTGSLKISDKSLKIGEQGQIVCEIHNLKKSTDLENLALVLDLPDSFELELEDGSNANLDNETKTISLLYPEFSTGQKEVVTILFTPTTQGAFSVRPSILTANYWRKESDKDKDVSEGGGLSEVNIDIELAAIEIRDPNSKNEVCPIINASKKFTVLNEEKSQIEIGDKFLFELELTNIGLSSAYNIQVEIIFPKDIELVDGIETLTASLNPSESRTFKYTLRTQKPGSYNIIVCDVRYYDIDKQKYITQLNDDYRVLVMSNIAKEFQYLVEASYDDLFLNEDEKYNIEKQIANSPVLIEQMKTEARFNAIISIIRNMIKTKGQNKEIVITEKVYTEEKRNLKVRNKYSKKQIEEPRKLISFSIEENPFFAINISDSSAIEFWAYPSLASRIYGKYISSDSFIFSDTNYELTDMLNYNDIEFLECDGKQKLGRALFSTWIDKSIDSLIKTQLRMFSFAKIVADNYGLTVASDCSHCECWINTPVEFSTNAGLSESKIWFIRNNAKSGNSVNFRVAFKITAELKKSAFFKAAAEKIKGFSFLKTGPRGGTEEAAYNTGTWHLTDRATQYISIEVTQKEDFEDVLIRIEELWSLLIKTHSHSLLEVNGFEKCTNIERLRNYYQELFDAGIASKWNPKYKWIELYSYKDFLPHQSKSIDSLGCISLKGKQLQFTIKTYANIDISSEELAVLELTSDFYNRGIVRHNLINMKQDSEDIERNEFIIDTFLKFVKTAKQNYEIGKLFVIPDVLFEEYFMGYCRAQSGVPALVKEIYKNNGSLSISESTKFDVDRKEINKTINRFKDHITKYNMSSFLMIAGTKNDMHISINESDKTKVDKIIEEQPELDFCEAGDPAKVREYVTTLKQCHPVLAEASTSPYWCDRKFPYTICGCKVNCGIAVVKKTCSIHIEFFDVDKVHEELIKILEECISTSSIEGVFYTPSGKKSQNMKLSIPTVDHDDYSLFSDESKVNDVINRFNTFLTESELILKKYAK